ncbi:hypothetical protein TRAPUB_12198 [Trametes pubescens]|uniref:BED-type domain-containing protein n=1 Tax=Trametes pubescens TaxID=154538 RepID=A0A1M2VUP2_TRAPU|nr:hypothetical protein TRAPUB_12198 [Trametes pubescens]
MTGDSAPSGSLSGPTLVLDPALNSDVPREPVPIQHYGSLVHKVRTEPPATSASDVWWFVYALDKNTAPSDTEIPRLQSQAHYKMKPEQKEFPLMACRFCRDQPEDGTWHLWRCQNGQTTAIRNHLKRYHTKEWRQAVIDNRLKDWEELAFKPDTSFARTGPRQPQGDSEPFTQTGFNKNIAHFVTGDDQVGGGYDPVSLSPINRETEANCNIDLANDPEYASALENDPVKRARQLIAACRASGQRREDFAAVIADGNRCSSWGPGKTLRQVQLLRDVDTRWSSTYLMIDRLLELYPAVLRFIEHSKQADLEHYLLSATELQVLQDIRQFLRAPHLVQELLSGEQTPTASRALPAYEHLLDMLKLVRAKYPKIAHGIDASILVLEQYMRYTRQTRAYALAMVINPSIKLAFLEKHWTPNETEMAASWTKEAVSDPRYLSVLLLILVAGQMLEHRKGLRQAAERSVADSATAPAPFPSHAPGSSAHNTVPISRQISSSSTSSVRPRDPDYDMLDELESELRRCKEARPSNAALGTLTAESSVASSHATETPAEREARLGQEDRVVVEDEFR